MTITLKVSENTKQKMIEYFADKKRSKTPDYAIFQADESDTVVTLYQSGKAVFQGVSADIDAQMWKEIEQNLNPGKKIEMSNSEDKKKKEKELIVIDYKIYNASTIGSDEVGTGDFFGPIVVSAAYVNKENISFLEELGVKDSKKMTDQKILEIVPKIIKKIPYKSLIFSNKEYNDKYSEDINMNKIKAILHNKVLLGLTKEENNYDYVVVDEFAKPYVYYNYLKDTSEVYRKITFMTKAESKCLSVACASLISRYIFLKEFDKLGQTVDEFLPKGAGDKVNEVALKIAAKYGINKLNDIAKINFKNYQKVLDMIDKK
ncbi:MAG TPA: ribonuclease HIII [Tenericutes bacterium]|nr:ribonuclease HIII [Mycoplasmatota bacterium]